VLGQTGRAQNNAIFAGGAADGYGQTSYHQPSGNLIFAGGSADGFEQGYFEQAGNNTIFASGNGGGHGDGFDQGAFQQAVNNALFAGGAGDGFSQSRFLLTESWSVVGQILMGNLSKTGGGAFEFSFTNVAGASFTVLATTNVAALPPVWGVLGAATEGPPGSYHFSDLAAETNNYPQRFYKVRYP